MICSSYEEILKKAPPCAELRGSAIQVGWSEEGGGGDEDK